MKPERLEQLRKNIELARQKKAKKWEYFVWLDLAVPQMTKVYRAKYGTFKLLIASRVDAKDFIGPFQQLKQARAYANTELKRLRNQIIQKIYDLRNERKEWGE